MWIRQNFAFLDVCSAAESRLFTNAEHSAVMGCCGVFMFSRLRSFRVNKPLTLHVGSDCCSAGGWSVASD